MSFEVSQWKGSESQVNRRNVCNVTSVSKINVKQHSTFYVKTSRTASHFERFGNRISLNKREFVHKTSLSDFIIFPSEMTICKSIHALWMRFVERFLFAVQNIKRSLVLSFVFYCHFSFQLQPFGTIILINISKWNFNREIDFEWSPANVKL